MGLGLSVTKMICKALNGKIILVRTGKDQGTKFKIILPVSLAGNILPKIDTLGLEEESDSEDDSESGNSDSGHE